MAKTKKKAARKSVKKPAAKKTVAKKAANGRRRGRKPAASAVTVGTLQGAVQNLTAALGALRCERDELDGRIAAVEAALTAMQAPVPAAAKTAPRGKAVGGPGRRRSGSLKEYIERVMGASDGVMAVKDITEGVLAAGYQTRNRTLAKSVGIALTEMPGVKKVGRGKFQLK